MGAESAFEELHQRRNEDFLGDAVILTWKAPMLRMGQDILEHLRPMVHKRRAVSSIHHERGDHDRGPLPEHQGVATHGISHDSAIRRGKLDHRAQMLPCRAGSGVSVCFLPGAFWLFSGSGLGATPHNAAHHVFMTLQAYTSTSEDQERHLGSGSKPWQVGKCREAMLSTYM